MTGTPHQMAAHIPFPLASSQYPQSLCVLDDGCRDERDSRLADFDPGSDLAGSGGVGTGVSFGILENVAWQDWTQARRQIEELVCAIVAH
jgi:hypothetical protein